MTPRPLKSRTAKVKAQYRITKCNPGRRVGEDIAIRLAAGGTLTHQQVAYWLDPPANCNNNPLQDCDRVIEVYIEQVCYTINRSKGVVRRNNRPEPQNAIPPMRAMLSQPHSFYHTIAQHEGEIQGSAMLRADHISPAEFAQLEYFFVPIYWNAHSCLIAVSPRHHTIELADSSPRETTSICTIFSVIIRFLIHELGGLLGPPGNWRFLHSQSPRQRADVDCGNYTCLYAKVLACGQPMRLKTDLGHGRTFAAERRIRHRVIDDLYHQARWSELICPIGNQTILQRHTGPGSRSERQNLPRRSMQPKHDANGWRVITRLQNNISVGRLALWCAGCRPKMVASNGRMVGRMEGYATWRQLRWSRFLRRIERREIQIRDGTYPP